MEELYQYLPHFFVLLLVIGLGLLIYPIAYRVTRDICVNPVTGKFAEKSTMAWGAYVIGIFTCLNDFVYFSITPVLDFHFDKVPFETKFLLFGASGLLAGANVAGKFFSRKVKDGYGNDLAPIVTTAPAPEIIAPLEPMDAVNTAPPAEVVSECPAAKQAALDAEKSKKAPFIAYPDRGVSE